MDLPLPVGPTTATSSPGRTSKLTPRSTGGRPSYANVRSANRTAASGVTPAAVSSAAVRASPSTCWMRSIEARPRRPSASVKPSATVGHAR